MASRIQEARRWLEGQVGYHQAVARVNREAALLRINPLSDMAVRHAVATYCLESGQSPYYGPTTPTTPSSDQGALL